MAWLRAAEAGGSGNSGGGGGSGSGSGVDVLAVMADSELVSAAEELDRQNQLDRDGGGSDGGAEDKAGVCDVSGEDRKDGEVKGKALDGTASGMGEAAGANYILQRELRRHPIWRTIELWEVSMSDSVVMATDGGGARAERWLPARTLVALDEVGRWDVLVERLNLVFFV